MVVVSIKLIQFSLRGIENLIKLSNEVDELVLAHNDKLYTGIISFSFVLIAEMVIMYKKTYLLDKIMKNIPFIVMISLSVILGILSYDLIAYLTWIIVACVLIFISSFINKYVRYKDCKGEKDVINRNC